MRKPKAIVLVQATSDSETLEALEEAGSFAGLVGSFSKGQKIPSELKGMEKANNYARTKLRVWDVEGRVETVQTRLGTFERTKSAKALSRIKKVFGDRVSFSASVALFYVCSSARIILPLEFVNICAQLGINISFVVYTDC